MIYASVNIFFTVLWEISVFIRDGIGIYFSFFFLIPALNGWSNFCFLFQHYDTDLLRLEKNMIL